MKRFAIGLIAAGILIGTISDRPRAHDTIMLGGYRVLAADFHTHSSTWSDGTLTPWGMVIEAWYQGLDAIAITGHRQTQDARWGRWFSEKIGGPIVLIGEEIPEIPQHVIAVGIHATVDAALPVAVGDRRELEVVVVITELGAARGAALADAVQRGGDLAPAGQVLAARRRQRRADDPRGADLQVVVDLLVEPVLQGL